MMAEFYRDLAKAKKGEAIVLDVLRHTTKDYVFNDVSDDEEYYYLGDIEACDESWNMNYYLDVKSDGCIAKTNNILCEEKVYCKDYGGYWQKGNMQSNYDALAIISLDAQKIFIIDFVLLKKHYKEGKYYCKDNGSQITYGTLFPLSKAWKYNMVQAVISYEQRGTNYFPVSVVRD